MCIQENHSKINLKETCFFCCATLRHALRRQGPLFLVARQSIEVTVKLLTGKNFPLEICTSKTIADVKKKIQKCQGLAAEGQRLIFAGKQLSDEAKVSECKLEAGNTIHLVMRTAGTSTSSTSLPGTIGTCESPGACGIFNLGNTCYLNSTLQALSNTRALRQYYDEGHYKVFGVSMLQV